MSDLFEFRLTHDKVNHCARIHKEGCADAGSRAKPHINYDEALEEAGQDGEFCIQHCRVCKPKGRQGCVCPSALPYPVSVVGNFFTALASTLHSMDQQVPEMRTSQEFLQYLRYSVENRNPNSPALTQRDEALLRGMLSMLAIGMSETRELNC